MNSTAAIKAFCGRHDGAVCTSSNANAVMRFAYRYRDYVVSAFNKDKPYDQFIVEQLAGDLLPRACDVSQNAEQVIATARVQ